LDLINPPLYLSMLTNNKEQLGLELLVIPGVKPKAAVLVANSAEGPLGINLILQLHLCILRMPFRVVQEGLTNIHRQSGSATAEISLSNSMGRLLLQIRDQGKGMSAASVMVRSSRRSPRIAAGESLCDRGVSAYEIAFFSAKPTNARSPVPSRVDGSATVAPAKKNAAGGICRHLTENPR
jgi:hypothetical protein